MSDIYDALIIGGGPSGMMSAIKAGERGLKVAVLEKKSRPGIKLSITGKGRCNITNSADLKESINCFRNGKFLYGAFTSFFNNDLIDFFENSGVPVKLERGGRYFPVSDKATDIVDALIKNLKKHSEIITSFDVISIRKNNDLFIVSDGKRQVLSKNIIIACGGASYPSTGSQGDGYKFARDFGHSIIKPVPALIPVIIENENLNVLRGLKLKNIEVSLIKDKKTISKEFGEMEFTSFGFDGPTILTLSGYISEERDLSDMFFSLNLKPALGKDILDQRLLRELDKFGNYQIKDMLGELLPKQLIKPFLNYCNIQMTKKCSQINKNEREQILKSLQDMRFNIKGVRDIKDAIITRGGVSTDEIDQKTMESKIVEGLFFCGEVIDIDAPTGGFNLQAAFSTGYLAGVSIEGE